MKRICLVFLVMLFYSISFAQITNPKFQFSNSAGFGFKESRPVFYIGLSAEISKDLFLGIKGGIYGFEENLSDNIFNNINSIYGNLSVGNYSIDYVGYGIPVQKSTYVAAFFGTYNLNQKFSVSASFGVKYYENIFYSNMKVNFYKPYNNSELQKSFITVIEENMDTYRKDILRPYYALGINYRIQSYSIGIFGDNIYSVGINLGKEF